MESHEKLSSISRYIHSKKNCSLEDMTPEYEAIMHKLKKFITVSPATKILEIGTGTGWFPLLCKKNGIHCKGIEISPQLVEYAKEFGKRNGIEADIKLGNIEVTDIGSSKFDVIVASSTFEHVEKWEAGIHKVFHALKPGGLFYFVSSNKYTLRPGECILPFPFYGWLPNSWRYSIQRMLHGKDIMKLGVDYNQFTYFQLRRFFTNVGFSKVLDFLQILDPNDLYSPRSWKKKVVKICKSSRFFRYLVYIFYDITFFICIK